MYYNIVKVDLVFFICDYYLRGYSRIFGNFRVVWVLLWGFVWKYIKFLNILLCKGDIVV